MIRVVLLISLLACLVLGCGGGGGGGVTPPTEITVVGSVIWVGDGQAPIPAATVQIDQATTTTSTTDGSFSLKAAPTATTLTVIYQNGATTVTFQYTIPAADQGIADMGEVFIGPEKVRVDGVVTSAIDSTPVQGALIEFAGRQATSGANGTFSVTDVAYSGAGSSSFFDIDGRVSRAGYLPQTFRALDAAVGGVVTLDEIRLVPQSGDNPPPPPYTITGKISPAQSAVGTVVTLKLAGTPIRRFTVGSDATYGFWVLPGAYVVSYQNPINNLTAPDESVDLTSQNEIITRDVTLR